MNDSFRKLTRIALIVLPVLVLAWLCKPRCAPEIEGDRYVNATVRRIARELRAKQVAKIDFQYLIGPHNRYTLSDPKEVDSFLLAMEKSTRDRRFPDDPLDAQWSAREANPELHLVWRFYDKDGRLVRELWSEAVGFGVSWGPEVDSVVVDKWPDFYEWDKMNDRNAPPNDH